MSADAELPDAPAPWQLRASGYIFVLRLSRAQLDDDAVTPPALRGARTGPFAYAMFVDYAQTPVGPYRELLFIPGAFRYADRNCWSVSKIYVSSEASVVNGRRNWGLPKQLAEFDVEYGVGGERVDRMRMRVEGAQAAELIVRHYPFGIPLIADLIPSGLRTLRQTHEGREYTFAPTARAPMRAARVLHAEIDPGRFPAFSPKEVFAAVKLPTVELFFPAAQVHAVTG